MDKFRMMFQFLQANQESFMNGICGIMALASAQLYATFEFTCPCLPEYNYTYGVGILVIPPIWFFMLGYVLNNNISMLTEEWRRPEGQRQKEPTVLRYMFVSITQRALIAPAVWIAVTLMDGKSFMCAYSARLDLQRFINQSVNTSESDLQTLLATIPCENIYNLEHVISREAATRYIRCISQACGWTFLMLTTLIAFLIRGIRPCFTQAVFLKTKYWSHYIDTERRLFDETCKEHAKSFAKVCIQHYFKSIGGEMPFHTVNLGLQNEGKEKGNEEEHPESEQDKLLGVCEKEDMNKVLWNWHTCKPALSLYKLRNELTNATKSNGFHRPIPVNEHVAYYSKV